MQTKLLFVSLSLFFQQKCKYEILEMKSKFSGNVRVGETHKTKTQDLKNLFSADIVYLQQLQQVISNGGGGPQLLTQDCVHAHRAASQMGGTFPPRWREQRERQFDHYRLATQLCSNTL